MYSYKKFISFFSILFLYPTISLATELPEDVASGNKYEKSLTGSYYKDYGMTVVSKEGNHPVRAGEKSIRFEVRKGDCGKEKFPGTWDDCKNNRHRHELSGKPFRGESWYAYSIFIPKDFTVRVHPVKRYLAQFHQKNSWPTLMFRFGYKGYFAMTQWDGEVIDYSKLLDTKDMLGKWNDILIHINSTSKDTGFYKVWVNGELKYNYKGKTTEGNESYFKFGIYQTRVDEWEQTSMGDYPTDVVYYDEVRTGKVKTEVLENIR